MSHQLLRALISEMVEARLEESYEDNVIENIFEEVSEETWEAIEEAILNELSPETMKNYLKKSKSSKSAAARTGMDSSAERKQFDKRKDGISRAKWMISKKAGITK